MGSGQGESVGTQGAFMYDRETTIGTASTTEVGDTMGKGDRGKNLPTRRGRSIRVGERLLCLMTAPKQI